MKLELINELFQYVSKKLPNFYIAGWSWFYGRTEAASVAQSAKQGEFWPNGARLAVSSGLMFEAGGQPNSGAGGPVTEPIQSGAPWF